MHLSAGTKVPVLHASLSYTARTNAPEKKGAGAKIKIIIIITINKAISPLSCDLRGCPLCIHEVQTDLKTALSLPQTPPPYPPTLPPPGTNLWPVEATTLEQTHQTSLIHSLPRCLCQVIAGGKRKTDQYISHGSDR